jgi:hypothetical protein
MWRWAYTEDLVKEPIMQGVKIEIEGRVRDNGKIEGVCA